MDRIRVETTIEHDGELHLTQLPCRKGERVEAILLMPDRKPTSLEQEAARQHFLALARASRFHSEGPYPSRDELHERP